MSSRVRLIIALCFAVSGGTATAGEPWAQVAPWGGQGEVQLPADASDADMQMASLRDERDRLQWVADAGGFPKVPSETLDLGVVHPAVEILRVRLTLSNDLPEALNWPQGSLEAQTYDFDVLQAVQRFQLRNGLEATGQVEGSTLENMNRPVDAWIAQIDHRLCQRAHSKHVPSDQPRTQDGVVMFTAENANFESCIAEGSISASATPVSSDAILVGQR
jgi:hypothetical protein